MNFIELYSNSIIQIGAGKISRNAAEFVQMNSRGPGKLVLTQDLAVERLQ